MIIGLSGKKRVGKDTFANFLILNYNFITYTFADPVKEVCRNMFRLSEEQLYGDKKEVLDERWNYTPRELFQKIGTEFGQYKIYELLPNLNCEPKQLWVKNFKLWYENNKEKNVLLTDVRFLHELKAVEDLGGHIIKINRDTKLQDEHSSETQLDNYRFKNVIENNGTLEELYFNGSTMMTTLAFHNC